MADVGNILLYLIAFLWTFAIVLITYLSIQLIMMDSLDVLDSSSESSSSSSSGPTFRDWSRNRYVFGTTGTGTGTDAPESGDSTSVGGSETDDNDELDSSDSDSDEEYPLPSFKQICKATSPFVKKLRAKLATGLDQTCTFFKNHITIDPDTNHHGLEYFDGLSILFNTHDEDDEEDGAAATVDDSEAEIPVTGSDSTSDFVLI